MLLMVVRVPTKTTKSFRLRDQLYGFVGSLGSKEMIFWVSGVFSGIDDGPWRLTSMPVPGEELAILF